MLHFGGQIMTPSADENLITLKRVMQQLEKQADSLREAIALGVSYKHKLPYQGYVRAYPSLGRDAMVVAFHEVFSESGLGGMCWQESGFPQSLHFGDDTALLIVRKADGFRNSPHEEDPQLEFFAGTVRIVLFWSWPSSKAKDVLGCLSLQMFDNAGPLEEAQPLSQRISLLRNAADITLKDLNPNHHNEHPKFDFGD